VWAFRSSLACSAGSRAGLGDHSAGSSPLALIHDHGTMAETYCVDCAFGGKPMWVGYMTIAYNTTTKYVGDRLTGEPTNSTLKLTITFKPVESGCRGQISSRRGSVRRILNPLEPGVGRSAQGRGAPVTRPRPGTRRSGPHMTSSRPR